MNASSSFANTMNAKRQAGLPCLLALGLVVLLVSGCQRPGYYPGVYPPNGAMPTAAGYPGFPANAQTGPASVFAAGQSAPQLVELQRRAQELDNNNRQLTAQIAQIQQQSTAYRERSELLARQLEDANRQNAQLLASSQQWADQARNLQANMSARGGARLTANNSMAMSTTGFQIPGAQVLTEGGAIRVRIASDQIFAPGTAQLNPNGAAILDSFIQIAARQFPRQRIGIEAHTDAASIAMGSGQMAGLQAQTVIGYLSSRGGFPAQQLVATVPGPNNPIADNSTPTGQAANRRIELVVYP